MTFTEKKNSLFEAIKEIEKEFYRKNFDKGIKYLGNKNIYAATLTELEKIYKRCLKLKEDLI